MKILYTAIFSIITLSINGQQTRCFSAEMQKQLEVANPSMQPNTSRNSILPQSNFKTDDDEIYVIPVVVHIVYHNEEQNISEERITTQIQVLNADFRRQNTDTTDAPAEFQSVAADTKIEFCLASFDPEGNPTNGITRTYSDTTVWELSFADVVKNSSKGGADGWPSGSYLNIWVCNLSNNVLGYAYGPNSFENVDGVVINYRYFGLADAPSYPYNLGRTATHEVGHWLNLSHIWGDDGEGCGGTDGIEDTPNQSDETFGCPDFPLTDECSPNPPGVMFMNYMDYTDDACMNLFTEDQKERMRSVLENSRASILLSPAGCNAIDPLPGELAELIIFPVPAAGNFTIAVNNFEGSTMQIEIYNTLGQRIALKTSEPSNFVSEYFELAQLEAGCYFVNVFNGMYFLSSQFMVY